MARRLLVHITDGIMQRTGVCFDIRQGGCRLSDRTRLSFIGGGVMAKAFVESLLAKDIVYEDDVMVSSRSWATLEVMRERHHVHTTLSNREAVQFGDIVLLAVKP